MSTIPHTLKFNCIGEWARQQSLFKLRDTYVAYGVRGLTLTCPGVGKKVPPLRIISIESFLLII